MLACIEAVRDEVRGLREALLLRIEEAGMLHDPRAHDPRYLGRHAARVFSQNYEDAILAEILSRIGEGSRRFLEIGIGDGDENVTRYLLLLGWSGGWIEGSADNVRAARASHCEQCAEGRLTILEGMVTIANVNELAREALGKHGGDVDVLSIDIDRNTSHVWRALTLRPRIAVIEYNAMFPPTLAYEVPYDESAVWDLSNHYGASLKTLERIGRDKGMSLVGCDWRGVNAFFVRDDLLGDHFLAPYTSEQHFQPARFNFSVSRGHTGRRPTLPGSPKGARSEA